MFMAWTAAPDSPSLLGLTVKLVPVLVQLLFCVERLILMILYWQAVAGSAEEPPLHPSHEPPCRPNTLPPLA